jgi:hypothetical protein
VLLELALHGRVLRGRHRDHGGADRRVRATLLAKFHDLLLERPQFVGPRIAAARRRDGVANRGRVLLELKLEGLDGDGRTVLGLGAPLQLRDGLVESP